MSHQLETIIGYQFKNPELLETALTHTSYANESRVPVKHNERLEFLGDSVLQIVSADYLFHAYADRPEGDLTRIRSSLVSEGALFQFAQFQNLFFLQPRQKQRPLRRLPSGFVIRIDGAVGSG